MTARNRHFRTSDHNGTLDSEDVDVDEIRLPTYPARTPLHDVLAGFLTRLGTSAPLHSFTVKAVIRKTITWQLVNAVISLDAVIGTQTPLKRPGFFTAGASIRRTQSLSRTVNAVIKRNQTHTFTIDAVKV